MPVTPLPNFNLARLPSLINFICKYWARPFIAETPINFKELS